MREKGEGVIEGTSRCGNEFADGSAATWKSVIFRIGLRFGFLRREDADVNALSASGLVTVHGDDVVAGVKSSARF